jgi:hypothetical protein
MVIESILGFHKFMNIPLAPLRRLLPCRKGNRDGEKSELPQNFEIEG